MKITSNYVVSIGSSTTCCSGSESITLFEGLNETSITLKFSPESLEALSSLICHLNLILTHQTTAKIKEAEQLQQLHCNCRKNDCIESGF